MQLITARRYTSSQAVQASFLSQMSVFSLTASYMNSSQMPQQTSPGVVEGDIIFAKQRQAFGKIILSAIR